LQERKIGLALGSGAVRGLAHIGVLKVMEKESIPIDIIAGTSAGAAIGAVYAQGRDASRLTKLTQALNWKRLASIVDLTLPKTGFISGKKIEDELKSVIGSNINFNDLAIPFACVATDIGTGEEVVINQGSVLEGVRVSISIPGIFTVVKLGGRYLVDGGLVNPVPVSVLKRMGADFIIAVNVIPDISAADRTHWMGGERLEKPKEPNIISVIMQSIYIGTHSLAKASLKDADVVIQPQVAHIGPTDFRRAQDCIEHGESAALASISEIRQKLEA
jgi:NTE family protein